MVTTLGAANSLNGPTFLALDTRTIGGVNATWLYVSEHGNTDDTGGGRILRYNLTSGATTATVVASDFTSPDTIIVDSSGDLIIADRAANTVRRIPNTGGAGSVVIATGQVHGPTGMVRDGAGNLFVAEHGDTTGSLGNGGGVVSKWNASGALVTAFGGDGRINGTEGGGTAFAVTGPYGVALDGNRLLVTDSFSSLIRVFDATTGAFITEYSTGSGTLPLGMSIDSTGDLWVAVSSGGGTGATQEVRRMSTTGGAASMTLTGGLSLPFHAVVDTAANRAYVGDYNNDRVVVFSLTGGTGSAPVINSAASATATVGQNFTYQITASNSPTSYAATGLPAGLTLNTSTGVIAGIPTTAGTSTAQLTATNASGTSASFALSFNVSAASSPGTPAAPLGPTVTAFDLVLASVVPGVSAEWEIVFDTPVTGVDVGDFIVNTQGAATATLTGVTAVNTTTYRVAMNYTDTNGAIQVAIRTSGTGISGGGNAFRGSGLTATPVYGTGTAPAADTTLPQVASVTAGAATGNNATFTVTFSEAVTGVDANDFIITGTSATIGAVSGSGTTYTVPVTASGSGTVTLTVVGGASSAIRDAAGNYLGGVGNTSGSVTIAGGSGGSAPTISNQTATGTVGSAFSYQVSATGATSYSITSGTLPAGLSMSAAGLISGTPTAAGSSVVTVRATNANGNASAQLTITIDPGSTGTVPTITSATTATATVGTAFTYQITASGSPTGFTATNLTGTGLAINATTGVISGTPTTAGTISSQLRASNANGTSSAVTLTITVSPASSGSAPTISNQTASGTVGTALSYQVSATGATSYAITAGTLPSGLSMSTAGLITGTPTAAGSSVVTVRATNANGNASAQLTITISPATAPSIPVVTAATVNGTVGVALSHSVVATNSPTGYAIVGQPAGVSINATTGVISGTPTASGTFSATVTATNAAGSGTGTITFVIGNSQEPPKKAQTISFSAPTSSIVIGMPVRLGASASSGLPVSYVVISGSATLRGDMLTVTGPGPVTVRATQIGDNTWAPASATITVTADKAAQVIQANSTIREIDADSSLTLTATATSGLPVTYTLVSGPATLSGNVLTPTGADGVVIVRASQAGNDSYLPAANVVLTFHVNAVGQQVYFGSLGTDHVAAAVSQDGSKGTLVLRVSATGEVVVVRFNIALGMFLAQATSTTPSKAPAAEDNVMEGQVVEATAGRTVSGTVADGVIRGTIEGLGAFTANVQPASGSLADYAGLYVATIPGSARGETYVFIAADGTAYGLVVTPTFSVAGTGTVSANGAVSIDLSDGGKMTANVSEKKDALTGTVKLSNFESRFAGISVSVNATDRMVNISSRLKVSKDPSHPSIVGFVVNGTTPKQMLIRAVGPTMSVFGFTNPLPEPRLKLYNAAGVVIASNNGWADNADVTAAGKTLGAFDLPTGSKDAAMVVTLTPGLYTAIIDSNGEGTALIEVYDVASNALVPSKQLVNISTRGYVGTGNDVLIGGFVVSGNQPKRVLIRAVGPSLSKFNVGDLLADPVLNVYDGAGKVIAKNDNWGTPQTVGSAQIAASVADINAAFSATGAFPLDNGTKDAVVIITLDPGSYTAMVSGANGTTGSAMVEIYEIPNP
ncbi:putative Ig domain-containing protein [Opitutus sp. ER46]|uniref:beta strand repeat-containing protein n=1 Tax=Opitutus sp. ER46 TaxID=2161864 RepID=UPI0011B20C76|nr:putative Ig domain-containing protein [Opitutus sp. ER46]